MGKNDVLSVLKASKNLLCEKYGITALGLFGSFARDEASAQSDVDICVRMREADPFMLVHVKAYLENALSAHVDIVQVRETMNPFLKSRIERDAVYV